MYGQLNKGNLFVSETKGEAPVFTVVFGEQVTPDQQRAYCLQVLHAPAMVSILEKLKVDIGELLMIEANERGGPVTGLASVQADPDFARVLEHQAEIIRLLAQVKGA